MSNGAEFYHYIVRAQKERERSLLHRLSVVLMIGMIIGMTIGWLIGPFIDEILGHMPWPR